MELSADKKRDNGVRRLVCWTERLEDRTKREVRVDFSSGNIKWQFKRSDEEKWDYDSPPSEEDWQNLLLHSEGRYRRRRMPLNHLELVRKSMPKGRKS